MSGITIVYNEHAAVPEESTCNYIAEMGGGAVMEEVIVDERVLCAAVFLPYFCTSELQRN